MEIVFGAILCVVAYLAFKWHVTKRGMRFVRAFEFMNALDQGASADEANGHVLKMFTSFSNPHEDEKAMLEAAQYVQSGGKQLPVIGIARSRGFIG